MVDFLKIFSLGVFELIFDEFREGSDCGGLLVSNGRFSLNFGLTFYRRNKRKERENTIFGELESDFRGGFFNLRKNVGLAHGLLIKKTIVIVKINKIINYLLGFFLEN